MSNEVSTEFVKCIMVTPWFRIQLFKGWGRWLRFQYNEHDICVIKSIFTFSKEIHRIAKFMILGEELWF